MRILWSVLPLSSIPCQSKTLSPPDFESTYTNKTSFEALAVCLIRQVENFRFAELVQLWWYVIYREASASLFVFATAGTRRFPLLAK